MRDATPLPAASPRAAAFRPGGIPALQWAWILLALALLLVAFTA